MILHSYFRSTASWRVRLALALKRLPFELRTHHLRRGEQRTSAYLALNPQGQVPTLQIAQGGILTQSIAIIEYLNDAYPDPPLLPSDFSTRARARAFAQVIACDIQPLQTMKALNRLRQSGLGEEEVQAWARAAIEDGLSACEALTSTSDDFAFGPGPGLADICLVPQLGNARRLGVEPRWPRLLAIERQCYELPEFHFAHPDNQPDAE